MLQRRVSEGAFRGTALLDISSENKAIDFRFNTYNRGRTLQPDVFRTMVDMMSVGDCPNVRDPLVVAVDITLVDIHSLAHEGSPNPLKTVPLTNGAVPLELLAGMHRVLAARAALGTLKKHLKVLRIRKDNTDGATPDGKAAAKTTKAAIEAASAAIKLIKTWPVRFYSIGTFGPRLTSSQTLTMPRRSSETRRRAPPKDQDSRGEGTAPSVPRRKHQEPKGSAGEW